MNVTVKIDNRMGQVTRRMDAGIERAVKGAAFGCEARVKWLMDQPKHGRTTVTKRRRTIENHVATFKKRRNPRVHTCSAPGEAPARETSTLYASLFTRKRAHWDWECAAGTNYAIKLEFGKGHLQARPFMRPAAKHIEPLFVKAVEKALGGA